MAWTVIWSDEALDDLASLDVQVARRILEKVESTLSNPERFFERLKGSRYYKLRVGDYRVLARLAHEDHEVVVRRAGHRSNIYG
jgi:mRNA interferase RelE/StbE